MVTLSRKLNLYIQERLGDRLFNNVVVASNGMREWSLSINIEGFGGSGRGPFQIIIPEFAWTTWEKLWKYLLGKLMSRYIWEPGSFRLHVEAVCLIGVLTCCICIGIDACRVCLWICSSILLHLSEAWKCVCILCLRLFLFITLKIPSLRLIETTNLDVLQEKLRCSNEFNIYTQRYQQPSW